MSRGVRRLGAIAVLVAVISACGSRQPVEVAIALTWNRDGVALADGRATLTSDLGYSVQLDRFEITTYSFELLPCEQMQQKKTSFSLIGKAWAGHRLEHPPTLTKASRVESPLLGSTLNLETLSIPDDAYCSGHYLIARLPESGIDPADTASIGISLRTQGRYRKGKDTPWTDFSVATPVSHGILVDLPQERAGKGIHFDNGDAVMVERRLDSSFNGVDFATMDQAAVARQILRQLVGGTRLVQRKGAG